MVIRSLWPGSSVETAMKSNYPSKLNPLNVLVPEHKRKVLKVAKSVKRVKKGQDK